MTPSLSLEQKIRNEKRRRSQVYNSLDYYLSHYSYFDYFSYDCFSLAKYIHFLNNQFLQTEEKSEIFLLAFFSTKNEVSPFFATYGWEEKILPYCSLLKSNLIENPHFFSRFFQLFSFFKKEKKEKQNQGFSEEILLIFEKAAEMALQRFKTPIITSEILFLTLMEVKETKAYQILKQSIINPKEWYSFRYLLIKKIYKQEIAIRQQVSINQRYFAYLLKSQLDTKIFEEIIEQKRLEKVVAAFRNTLVGAVLKENFFDHYYLEILQSIELTKSRTYST